MRNHLSSVVRPAPSPAGVSRIEGELDCGIELKIAEGDIIARPVTGHPAAPAVAHIYLGSDSFEGLDERFARIASRLDLTFEQANRARAPDEKIVFHPRK